MPRTRATTPTSVYQVLVTLQDIAPTIWWRLVLPNDLRLSKLHRVLQCVFDWDDYHLHQFIAGDTFYGVPDPEWDEDMSPIDERTVPLHRVLRRAGDTLVYEYDSGGTPCCSKRCCPAIWIVHRACVLQAHAHGPPKMWAASVAMKIFSPCLPTLPMKNTTACCAEPVACLPRRASM